MPTAAVIEKIKSSKFAVLLNTGSVSSPVWSRIGKGVSSLPISYNAKTTTETYVDEDNATTDVEGYEVSFDTEHTAMKNEPVFDFVNGIRKGLKVGSECETQAILVDIYDMTITSGSGSGTGQKFGATIVITDLTIEGGKIAKLKYKVAINGDPEDVTVSIANKTITVGTSGGSGSGGSGSGGSAG